MASNKRINKAYVRYDGSGRVIAGSLILNRFKPQVGNWQEIPAYECCNSEPLALRLLFSNILEVGGIVGDVTDVANWNTYFDLPAYGSPFTSVEVVGNEVQLFGGSNIVIKEMLFDQPDELGTYLLEVDDAAGSVIELEYDAFGADNNSGCPNLVSVNLPEVTSVGDWCFYNADALISVNLPKVTIVSEGAFYSCDALVSISLPLATTIGDQVFSTSLLLSTISLPSCINLGSTVGDNNVFNFITGNTITLTIPSALMTADAGNPDGDIVYLQANNTVTVVTV